MELLVQQGKAIYIGSSNFAGWHIAQANEIAKRRNFLGLVSEQSLYNLNARTVERDLVPACEAYGVGIIPWSPLGGGFLAGLLNKPTEGRRAGMADLYARQGASLATVTATPDPPASDTEPAAAPRPCRRVGPP